jgi:hypothetical protein
MTNLDAVIVGLFLMAAAVVIQTVHRRTGRARAGKNRPVADQPILYPVSARSAPDLVEVPPASAAGFLAAAGVIVLLASALNLVPV